MGSNGQGWGISVDPWIRIRKINLPAEGIKTSHKILIISSLRYILDSFIKECVNHFECGLLELVGLTGRQAERPEGFLLGRSLFADSNHEPR